MTIEQVGEIPAFRIRYQGEEVTVDHRTFTLGERRRSRRALVELTEADDLSPDFVDQLAALAWVVLTRSQPELSISDLFEQVDLGDIADGEVLTGETPEDESDPEA